MTFLPFSAEPLVFQRLRQNTYGPFVLWVLAMAVLGVVFATAAIQNTLSHPDAVRVVLDDIGHVLGRNRGHHSTPAFPLLRDVIGIVVIAGSGVHFRILFSQWAAMHAFLPELSRSGALRPSEGRTAELEAHLARINRRFRRAGTATPLLLVIALAMALVMILGQRSGGVFRLLAPEGLPPSEAKAWAQAAYDSWWASDRHPLGFTLYVALATLALHYLMLQNIIGASFVSFFVRHRRHFNYGADVLNADGAYGWAPLTRLLNTVYASLLVNAVVLSMLSVVFEGRIFGVIGLLLGVIVVMGPVYLLTPVLLLRPAMRRFKQAQRDALTAAATAAAGREPSSWLDVEARRAYRAELAEIARVTPFPIGRRVTGALFLYALPLAIAVIELAGVVAS